MTTSGRAGTDRHRGISPSGNTLWASLECLLGGVAAGVLVLFALPTLSDLARSLGLLSTTVLAFVFLFLWLSLWAVIGTVHERVWTVG
ncbi:hypothetical protein [Halobellus rarus]|uniref:Uncharacterized protein n=1 Tax=Halobellus rarus TaxID=1126237 RepID=A0ABD6CKG7_9EURY|nr:hypothetical protein [Halobellus rarus]